MVDIFAPAGAAAVTTLDNQRREILRFLRLDPGSASKEEPPGRAGDSGTG